MSNVTVNLEGLNDEQLTLIARFAEILRHAGGESQVRAELARLWSEWSRGAPPMDEDEAEALSRDALRFARRSA
jgi:hypothetical protein